MGTSEDMREASKRAREFAKTAVATLAELMCDTLQSGSVRVSAAKTIIYCALKLPDSGEGNEVLALLDELAEEWHSGFKTVGAAND